MIELLLKGIREGLGRVVVFFDYLTRPQPLERSPDEQECVEQELEGLSLYQFYGCPFCVKVRRAAHKLNLPLDIRDAQNDPDRRAELKEGGGQVKVPCLRIDSETGTEWLYESDDIIDYLENKFESS